MNLLAQSPIDFNGIQSKGEPDATFSASTKIGDILAAAIPWIFTIAGMVLLVYLIFGGIQLMLSRGDPKAAGAAKAHITNALVGFIIIFIAYWVVQLIGIVFYLPGITNIFK
ncbi:MAG TPA: hypothetical protein VG895_04620 [Patescibacteria group bacterium]|nr:hypothetical protein [Patescibacteria group bacterium]